MLILYLPPLFLAHMARGQQKLAGREALISITMVLDIIAMARDRLMLDIRNILFPTHSTTQHTITVAAHTLQ